MLKRLILQVKDQSQWKRSAPEESTRGRWTERRRWRQLLFCRWGRCWDWRHEEACHWP